MKSLILSLCLLGISQGALAKIENPLAHRCFAAARSIAVNKFNKERNNPDLVKFGMAHDRCIWNTRTELVECFVGKETFSEYSPSNLWVNRVSPSREDLTFEFSGGTQGLDIGVLVRFRSTPKKPCDYIESDFYVEQNGEE